MKTTLTLFTLLVFARAGRLVCCPIGIGRSRASVFAGRICMLFFFITFLVQTFWGSGVVSCDVVLTSISQVPGQSYGFRVHPSYTNRIVAKKKETEIATKLKI